MDCIKQLSTRQLVHIRMVSLLFVIKFLTKLVTGQEYPARAQLPCLPDKISKAETLLSYFESHKQALHDRDRQRSDALAQ